MKKVKFLARKLKAFSFNDIFSLAELPKEELQEKLDKLVEENILKKTTQGYIYCEFDYVPPPTAPTVKGEAVTFVRDDDYVKFSENDYGKMKSLSLAELGNIPEYNRKNSLDYLNLQEVYTVNSWLSSSKNIINKILMTKQVTQILFVKEIFM